MKIFYSWISDLPSKENKNFIDNALEIAIRNIKSSDYLSQNVRDNLHLDKDTSRVPGMPDIMPTILNKIDNSIMFVGDVSFIGKSNNGKKLLPNPNVMAELGYALGQLGSEKIICILNTDTGNFNDLPFDLRNKRKPLEYSKNSKSAKKNLIKDLENAISVNIEQGLKPVSLDMNSSISAIYKAILQSNPMIDWESHTSNQTVEFYNKTNPLLRINYSYADDQIICSDFKEGWANKHISSKASSFGVNIKFNNHQIGYEIFVTVDGGRASLPLPNNRTQRTISEQQYKIGEILDVESYPSIDEYLLHSEINFENMDEEESKKRLRDQWQLKVKYWDKNNR